MSGHVVCVARVVGDILETRQMLCTTETNGIIFNRSNTKTAVYPPQGHDPIHGSSKLQATILASEWGSRKGGLCTINRSTVVGTELKLVGKLEHWMTELCFNDY